MGTLAKVAIGIAVAKGVGSMIQKAGAGSTGGTAGSGGAFGGPHSPGGGLGDMMGEALGGRRTGGTAGGTKGGMAGGTAGGTGPGGAGGGIGDFLEELGSYRSGPDGAAQAPTRAPGGTSAGTSAGTPTGGGLDDLLGQIAGAQGGGGLGDLLGGLLGGLAGGASRGASGGAAGSTRGGSFGEILDQSLGNRGEPDLTPSPDQNAAAGLMLRAMIQAAKSDGRIDAAEQRKLLGNLGDVSAEERRFVEAEMQAPVDVAGLARQVPRGLEPQVYTMSVMAIDLDNRNEAQYLHQFASALGLDAARVNQIHARLGVPQLYA
jgi:uncharacterized membrane protein YebE (DUF533 family)